ncbi:hypothetical protein ACFFIY_08990 [Bhargavaea ullalensis]|uniref:Uncharacterized protein n=1 Tax=Bhargavaea ullalensis TaxID=1265685 RepID=A0ABV2GAD1_9BACL
MEKDRIQLLDETLAGLDGKDRMAASEEICRAVKELFGFDYHRIPILLEVDEEQSNCSVLAEELKNLPALTGEHVRPLLLRMFGTNLDGIVAIEKAPVSIRSKDNWVKRHDGDLVMITGGYRDLDVVVSPTDEFVTVTGNEHLSEELIRRLESIGYVKRDGHAFYEDPEGKPIPVDFKTKTIATITEYFEEFPLS